MQQSPDPIIAEERVRFDQGKGLGHDLGGRVRATTSSVARPAPTATRTTAAVQAGIGATAQCNDGNYSYAAHHQGACSRHGGVRQFYR